MLAFIKKKYFGYLVMILKKKQLSFITAHALSENIVLVSNNIKEFLKIEGL